ncbi:glycosyltransferase family 4 protein (plasmid) [Pedobacter sp. BS3]|uniref:glycosyltransferase family 4 protein n=1 Tax=Pedobacter sp. BS3 TaxID=2567937 RepID=UPI0011EF3160|nr:glycosyltransferase family 4 protein [Pedobacter sp. BS3]TZF86446.1 glycosyltransferase family 4 protein [Pedobacter sp. BS3]
MKNSKDIKIGFVTIDSPRDRRSWSGINYMVLTHLETHFENIDVFGPLKDFYLKKLLSVFNKISLLLFRKRYNYGHSVLLAYLYSYQLNRIIKRRKNDYEVIISVISSPALAFLKTSAKIIYLTDATFLSLVDYYVFDLWKFSIRESNHVEKCAIKKCNHIIFSSEWALNESVINYDIDRKRTSIAKFGSNVNIVFDRPIEREVGRDKVFNLLFVGVDWNRKGGDILLRSYLSLKEKGYDNLCLTICGTIPPCELDSNIKIYPFLDKNKEVDLKTIQSLYQNSHLFILPTRAECSAIVYAEAAAFSLPVITTETGGVCSYVENLYNGYTLPLEADYIAYESAIVKLMTDQVLYDTFSRNAYKKFRAELNWGRYFTAIDDVIEQVRTGSVR